MAYSGNGAGTIDDPYQVTTIPQLREAMALSKTITDPKLYIKIMNDLDFNDYPEYWECPERMFVNYKPDAINSTEDHLVQTIIDGNNKGIYNIFCLDNFSVFETPGSSGRSDQCELVIKNLIIETVLVKSTNLPKPNLFFCPGTAYSNGIYLQNCDIRIKYYYYMCNNDGEGGKLFTHTILKNCIINIAIINNKDGYSSRGLEYIILNSYNVIQAAQLKSCYNEWNIKFIYISKVGYGRNTYSNLINYSFHCFSSFFMEFISIQPELEDNSVMVNISSRNATFDNCYFVVKETGGEKFRLANYGVMNGVNFYDKEISNNRVDYNDSSILALTTAQCKDASYLESQGFIIAV